MVENTHSSELISSIDKIVGDTTFAGAQSRQALHQAAVRLARATADPGEESGRLMMHCPEHVAMMTALRMGLFEAVPHDMSSIAVTELGASTGADPVLINRLMRALAATGTFDETAPETYRHNAWSTRYHKGLVPCFNFINKMVQATPDFLESISYRNPCDNSHAPFNVISGAKGTMWEWFAGEPDLQRSFSAYMEAGKPPGIPFPSIFPLCDRLDCETSEGVEPSEITHFVDIGGAHGQVIDEIKDEFDRRKVSTANVRFILQDLPETIDVVKAKGGKQNITLMPYDIFTEQPVRGAAFYLLRHILHDWNDELSHKVLTNTAAAMDPGKSRLLVAESVLLDQGASMFEALLDVHLITIAGQERTEKQWRQLIEGVKGLQVVKVWRQLESSISVIEVMKEAS